MLPWSIGALALALVVLAGDAAAQHDPVPRVGVGAFTGPRAEFARGAIASALNDHAGEITLVPLTEITAALARLGAGGQTGEALAGLVGRELRLDDVVIGTVDRRGHGYRLQLRVLRSRDAHNEGTLSWEMDRVEELTTLRNELWDQVHGYFRVDSARAPAPPPTGATGATRAGSTPAPDAAPVSTAGRDPSAPGPPDPPGAEVETARTPGLGWLLLSLGGGLAGRSWRIPILGEPTVRGYENNAFGDLRGELGLLYRLRNQRLGIGLAGRLDFPAGLSSQGTAPDGTSVPLATSALEVQAGPTVRVRPADGGFLRLDAGLVLQSFSLDTSHLATEMRVTKMSYIGLRVAGEGVLPLYATADWEFGLLFGGELRWAGIGADAKAAYGSTPTTTFGIGAWLGLEVRLDRVAPGLGLRATAEFLRYRTSFAGAATVGTGSDSVDDYTHLALALTYAFGTERPGARPDPHPAGVAPPGVSPGVTPGAVLGAVPGAIPGAPPGDPFAPLR